MSLACLLIVVAPGCGDDSGGGGGNAGDAQVEDSGPPVDALPSDAGCATELCGPFDRCCEEGEECVNDWQCLPICQGTRCGENSEVCCPQGQICLDGVDCAASCLPTQTLCGEGLDLCCPSGDVCLNNACVTPGAGCENDFDCIDDGWYCEETIHRCLPLPSGPLCEGEPQFTDIEPYLEWYWPGITYNGRFYQNILAAPVVGDVDGDGTPDVVVVVYQGSSYATDNLIVVLDGAGDGAGNGKVLFTIPSADDPTAPIPYGLTSPALANFDDDPGLEIVYAIVGGGVRIADNDGIGDVCDATAFPGCSGRRTTGAGVPGNTAGGITVADLNHDGVPDVLVGCQAMDGRAISNASLDLVNTTGCNDNTVVADLDEDGRPEIIDARHAITVDASVLGGIPLWTTDNGVTSGFVAVADLLPDVPGPEVINIRSGFYVMDGQTGAVLIGPGGSIVNATIPIPGAGTGGAPTVADFDGDGLPEVSTAGLRAYVVYDPDCWDPPARTGGQCHTGTTDMMLWSTETQDLSSSQTGSSVFDFQGDGVAEVLYNDECFFHIYDGLTGAELVDPVIPSSSRTSAEYPLVADVDGDGNAEMIVVSNQDQAIARDHCDTAWQNAGVSIDWLCQLTVCTAGPACTGGVGGTCATAGYQCDQNGICQRPGGTHGVRVYGDSNDRWVKTRPVWNQFAYHVTNIEFNGGYWDVPIDETPSWTTYNNYRQNVQGGVLFPVPDLRVELVTNAVCPSEIRLVATVRNAGSAGSQALVPVRFYRVDLATPELIETLFTSDVLLPGEWERLSTSYPVPEGGIAMRFRVEVDDGDVVEECENGNNMAEADSAECPGVE